LKSAKHTILRTLRKPQCKSANEQTPLQRYGDCETNAGCNIMHHASIQQLQSKARKEKAGRGRDSKASRRKTSKDFDEKD